MWFQYVVGYDKQEQRSLATSLHNRVFDYGRIASNVLNMLSSYLGRNVLAVAAGITAFAGGRRRGEHVVIADDVR